MDEQINTDNAATLAAALRLIADIRAAAGDPEGKLMQDELVERIREMRQSQITAGGTIRALRHFIIDIQQAAGDWEEQLTRKDLVDKIKNMHFALVEISRNTNALYQIEKMVNAALK